jgi:hypothetical protein
MIHLTALRYIAPGIRLKEKRANMAVRRVVTFKLNLKSFVGLPIPFSRSSKKLAKSKSY